MYVRTLLMLATKALVSLPLFMNVCSFRCLLFTLYLIEAHFNAFANSADLAQAALVRTA